MGKKDTGYLYKALMDAIRGMMWPAMPSLTACSLDCTCVVLRSLSTDRKNYAKVAQAGSTGYSFMLQYLTNAAVGVHFSQEVPVFRC